VRRRSPPFARVREGSAPTALALAVSVAAMLCLGACSHLVVLHDPLTAPEHNDLGLSYERGGEPRLARNEYRHALRIDRHFVTARVNLGNLEAARGRWRSAEKQYRRALRDSADADAMNNLAVALLRQRRNGEATEWAERAVHAGGPRDSTYRATLEEAQRAGK